MGNVYSAEYQNRVCGASELRRVVRLKVAVAVFPDRILDGNEPMHERQVPCGHRVHDPIPEVTDHEIATGPNFRLNQRVLH